MPFEKGNPGRPKGARQRLGDAFLENILEDWRANGITVLKAAQAEKPLEYCKMIADLLPKEAKIDVSGTVTHKSEPVSELNTFLEQARAVGQDSKDAEPLPH